MPGRLERLCALYPTPGYCDEAMIFFRASARSPVAAAGSTNAPDEDEDIHAQTFTIAEAKAMARGEIVDLKSAYGLTLL